MPLSSSSQWGVKRTGILPGTCDTWLAWTRTEGIGGTSSSLCLGKRKDGILTGGNLSVRPNMELQIWEMGQPPQSETQTRPWVSHSAVLSDERKCCCSRTVQAHTGVALNLAKASAVYKTTLKGCFVQSWTEACLKVRSLRSEKYHPIFSPKAAPKR